MADEDIKVSGLPAAQNPGPGSLIALVDDSDSQTKRFALSGLLELLNLVTGADLNSSISAVSENVNWKRTATHKGSTVAGASLPPAALGVWTTEPVAFWSSEPNPPAGGADANNVQSASGQWFRRVLNWADLATLQTELRSGRVYALDAITPSAAYIEPGADVVIARDGITSVSIWTSEAAPVDGLETSSLKKDSGDRWWRVIFDSSALLGSGVIPLSNVAGSANSIMADLDVPQEDFELEAGMLISLVPTLDTTTVNPTLMIDGVVRDILDVDGGALEPGALQAGAFYVIRVVDDEEVRLVTSAFPANLIGAAKQHGDTRRTVGAAALTLGRADFDAQEDARIDLTSNLALLRRGGSMLAYEVSAIGEQPLVTVDQVAIDPTGSFSLVRGGKAHATTLRGGLEGGWFQPAVTNAYNPGVPGMVATGLTAAPFTEGTPVEYGQPQVFSGGAGRTSRYVKVDTANTSTGVYQVDVVVRPNVAISPFMAVRFPSGFANPDAGGQGTFIVFNMVAGTVESRNANGGFEEPTIRDLGDGFFHIRVRCRAFSAQTGQYFGLVPLPGAGASLSNDMLAGEYFVLAHFSNQKIAAVGMPVAPGLTNANIEPTKLSIPVEDLPGTHRTGTFECLFALPEGFPEGNVIPIWRIDDGGTRGFGVEIVGREIHAVLWAPSRVSVKLADLYSSQFHVAFSYDGKTLAMAVNGKTVTDELPGQLLGDYWKTLRFGLDTAMSPGTVSPFSGVIAYWRYSSFVQSVDQLRATTLSGFDPAPGETAPVVIDSQGNALLSRDAKGRVNLAPGTELARALSRGSAFSRPKVPDDAMAITDLPDGLHFLSDKWGKRTHRVKQVDGRILLGHDRRKEVDVIWGNGQSLMYAHNYGNAVRSDDSPYFLDVDDGLASTVFGYSVAGKAAERLSHPFMEDSGGGGAVYPFGHMLSELRAEEDPTPVVTVGKAIGQSGAVSDALWPWGVYSTDPYNGPGGSFNPDTPLANQSARPATHWNNVRRWHQSVKDSLDALGLKARVPAHFWVHGTSEGSTNVGAYYDKLLLSRADLLKLEQEFFGIENVPLWLMTQSGGRVDTSTNRWPIIDDQNNFADDFDDVILTCPLYAPPVTITDANVHPDYEGTTYFGEVSAWAFHEVQKGRKWHIGQPVVTLAGTTLTLDYSRWLRDDESLMVAPDTYYGGVGIDSGRGIEIKNIEDETTLGVAQRYGPNPLACAVTNISISADGKSYIVSLDQEPTGTFGIEIGYAIQTQDMTTADPFHFAHRGLLRTTLTRPSHAFPDRELHRWMPSFRHEIFN